MGFVLVQHNDGIHHVYAKSSVQRKTRILCLVGPTKQRATFIGYNDDEKSLIDLRNKLNENLPHLELSNLSYDEDSFSMSLNSTCKSRTEDKELWENKVTTDLPCEEPNKVAEQLLSKEVSEVENSSTFSNVEVDNVSKNLSSAINVGINSSYIMHSTCDLNFGDLTDISQSATIFDADLSRIDKNIEVDVVESQHESLSYAYEDQLTANTNNMGNSPGKEIQTNEDQIESNNESEYQPSEFDDESDSDSDSDPDSDHEHENIENYNSVVADDSSTSKNASFILNASFNVPGNSACDDKNLKADLSHGRKGGQKKSFCIYCHKIYSKLPRHLYDKHRSEEAVAKILSYPQGSDARKQEISSLRKKGNFLHNVTEEDSSSRGVLKAARETMGRIHERASDIMRHQIIPAMKEDNVVRLIRYDKTIILFGNKMCKKYRHQRNYAMIRSRLRLLGRLKEELMAINPKITEFAKLYKPKYYDNVIEALNKVANLTKKGVTEFYESPTNASILGTLLKEIGLILDDEYIKSH
ncbi:hypothetical protein PV326_010810 [Microctonus aethiopoides]|nr:hypothetical protein PV326_010810 [Microctonus aethiopoides]